MQGDTPKTLQKWMGHKSIETTMKYYVVSPEDFEQDVIKRLDVCIDKSADTQTDTSKEKGLQDDPQTLDNIGGPWRDRTSDPLIKSLIWWKTYNSLILGLVSLLLLRTNRLRFYILSR